MVALATTTLGSAASTVTFSSIPGTYRDLRLVISATASGGADLRMSFNGDNSDGNYSRVVMSGNGSSTFSVTSSPRAIDYYANATSGSEPNVITVDVMDYMATDKHKTSLARANRAGSGTDAIALRWASTSAVTTILIDNANSQTFSTGSTFALYGIVSA